MAKHTRRVSQVDALSKALQAQEELLRHYEAQCMPEPEPEPEPEPIVCCPDTLRKKIRRAKGIVLAHEAHLKHLKSLGCRADFKCYGLDDIWECLIQLKCLNLLVAKAHVSQAEVDLACCELQHCERQREVLTAKIESCVSDDLPPEIEDKIILVLGECPA